MTSIYDIPYEYIEKFLLANNKILTHDDDYGKALILLKDKNSVRHPMSIIEWMIAHNLLIQKVNIPHYTVDDIDSMSQQEVNNLAKLLTMKGNNLNNIKNILRYLHKLHDMILLPEINDIILDILYDTERKEQELLFPYMIKSGKYNDLINLLNKHHNKQMIRELISDNVVEIISYLNTYLFNANTYFEALIIRLLEYDELGLAKKFYDHIKILNPYWKSLSYDIINKVYYDFYNNNFENLFKISSSIDLFNFFIEKKKDRYDISDKLKILYIRFLRTAIKLQKLEFIKLMVEYFNNNPLDDIKMINDIKIKNQIKEFEDLIFIAKEMI